LTFWIDEEAIAEWKQNKQGGLAQLRVSTVMDSKL